MAFEILSDDVIAALLDCPKELVNPQAKKKVRDGHEQVNYKVVSSDKTACVFSVYKRQNLREGMTDDFSCGISWVAPNGESLTLRRYNGPSHNHFNQLEKYRLGYICHIHEATEKYIKANRKPEGYASETDRFTSLEGAFHCLITDCKISGISTLPDETGQTKLFD
ncbi:hypothetical protein CYPRO_2868 [Cyclonatronum proteinivorum]|uniref:Uncharacterized protein n=1 Tax=Cyclonatronum proteinivorum TaxID=1457365 RepID=A0A345UNQ4_9BACT|nr:hypothetical protein [Cyclonatronum proteinivorum]AXJ02106.1 hypothetical protein CYPRO_2868 [Cyclonatronum proteinivorum]